MIIIFGFSIDSIPCRHHGKILPRMNIIVVQSESAVQLLTFELVLLHALVRADVADYSSEWIIVGNLLFCAVPIHYHSIVSHVVLYVVMPAIDCAIGILQLR